METGLTWIDERMATSWGSGEWSRHYTAADHWIVYLDETRTSFVVLAVNCAESWIGGDDTGYSAREVADAIDRWSMETSGVDACPQFIEALERDLRYFEAKGTQLEIIRAQYLRAAMQARCDMSEAEDALPFTGYAQCQPADDTETSSLIVPWEAGNDG